MFVIRKLKMLRVTSLILISLFAFVGCQSVILPEEYGSMISQDMTEYQVAGTIGKKPFVDTYKSDVRYKKKDDLIHVTNIGGPLKHLENNWKFIQKENFTEVHFDVDFEIKNKFLDMIMTKSFEFGLNKIADAFQKKAESL